MQGRGSTETWVEAMGTTPSCTLDVVLITFKDTTGRPNAPDTVQLDYHLYDLPYKYTQHGAPGDSSYKLADFERLFNGGYDANGAYDAATVFFGDTVTVANTDTHRDTLPAVFGPITIRCRWIPRIGLKGRPAASFSCTRA